MKKMFALLLGATLMFAATAARACNNVAVVNANYGYNAVAVVNAYAPTVAVVHPVFNQVAVVNVHQVQTFVPVVQVNKVVQVKQVKAVKAVKANKVKVKVRSR